MRSVKRLSGCWSAAAATTNSGPMRDPDRRDAFLNHVAGRHRAVPIYDVCELGWELAAGLTEVVIGLPESTPHAGRPPLPSNLLDEPCDPPGQRAEKNSKCRNGGRVVDPQDIRSEGR